MAQITTGDPIIGTFNGKPGEFDLLSYIDDSDLMVQLGINAPSPIMGENNLKLVDVNASEYITLQPPTPQQEFGSQISQTRYYAIDTEEVSGFQGMADVSDANIDDNISHVMQLDAAMQLDGASLQTTAGDSAAHIVLNTSDSVSPFVFETSLSGNTPPMLMNTVATPEQRVIVAQETSDGFFIITSDPSDALVNVCEAQAVVPQTVSTSPVLSRDSMESVIPSGSDTSQHSFEQLNTPAPVKSVRNPSQSKPRSSRRQRVKKPKKYEITQELCDPTEEKKRLNAINAKKNRDRKKNKLKDLAEKVEAVTRERDALRKEVEELKRREKQLREALISKNFIPS